MSTSKMDDYLQQGIHGAKQTKPDERRRFLSTLRERVVVALTQEQVREQGIYPQVEALMHDYPNAHLFLNGNMSYPYLSKYTTIARKLSVEFTIVTNQEHDSDLGLVLALDDALDKEDIFIKNAQPKIEPAEQKKKSLFSIFQNLFKN